MATLPHCDELFIQFFDRWYDEEDRQGRQFSATRPDLLKSESLIGASPSDACRLSTDGQREAFHRIEVMTRAARKDWPPYLSVSGDLDLTWIAAFDRYYNESRIDNVIRRSDPEDFSNDYLVLCCEFGAVLGQVMRTIQPRLVWLLDWPYWESALLDPQTGNLIPVFHWAIKKLSGYGWDDGFADKVKACIELLENSESQS